MINYNTSLLGNELKELKEFINKHQTHYLVHEMELLEHLAIPKRRKVKSKYANLPIVRKQSIVDESDGADDAASSSAMKVIGRRTAN